MTPSVLPVPPPVRRRLQIIGGVADGTSPRTLALLVPCARSTNCRAFGRCQGEREGALRDGRREPPPAKVTLAVIDALVQIVARSAQGWAWRGARGPASCSSARSPGAPA